MSRSGQPEDDPQSAPSVSSETPDAASVTPAAHAPAREASDSTAATVVANARTVVVDRHPSGGTPTDVDVSIEQRRLPPHLDLRGPIGRGGMSLVFAAFDEKRGEEVAVKLSSLAAVDDPVLKRRLTREVDVSRQLADKVPGLIHVLDADVERGWIEMPLLRGGTLSDRIKKSGPLSVQEAKRVAQSLLCTLEELHAAKIIHRDIKPSNILFDDDQRVYLGDLGVAHAVEDTITGTGAVLGTPAFMAPEQLRGLEVDARADLYALAASLFEAVSGRRLHGGTRQDVHAVIVEATQDEAFAASLARALREAPEERFESARAFAAALGPLPLAVPPPKRRVPVAAAAAALIVVVALTGVVWRALDPPRFGGPFVLAPVRWSAVTAETRAAVVATLAERLRSAKQRVITHDDRAASQAASAEELATGLDAGTVVALEVDVEGDGARVRLRALPARKQARERLLLDERVPRAGVAVLMIERAPGLVADLLDVEVAPPERRVKYVDAMALASAAIAEGLWSDALETLQRAELERPGDGDIAYRQAVVTWWASMPDDVVARYVERALKLTDDDRRRAFLGGLQQLSQRRMEEAATTFEAALARWPTDPDLLYGEFEALYHDGRPDEAMQVYRKLVEVSPGFRLGQYHLLTRARALGDDGFTRWAIAAVAMSGSSTEEVVAASRALGEGRPADALKMLRNTEARWGLELVEDRMMALAALGDMDEIEKILPTGGDDGGHRLSVVVAQGDRSRLSQVTDELLAPRPGESLSGLVARYTALLAQCIGEEDRDACARHAQGLRAAAREPLQGSSSSVPLAIADDVAGHAPAPPTARETRMILEALELERRGDPRAAAEVWARTASIDDGRPHAILRFREARARRLADDKEGLVAACRAVLYPRVVMQDWGMFVGPCLAWSIDALHGLGRHADERALAERLVKTRRRAPAGDPLLASAKRALAEL